MNARLMNPQPPALDTLGELMSRVAMRDQAAFKQLYDSTACCLLGIAVRMLHDRSWAEEVLQEIYVSVWHTAQNYSPLKSQPMTWLMTVARHKAMDALRGSRADRQHCVRPTTMAGDDDEGGDDGGPPDMADQGPSPLDQLVQAIDAQQLRCCLQRLEPQQRQAIALAFLRRPDPCRTGAAHASTAGHRQGLGAARPGPFEALPRTPS